MRAVDLVLASASPRRAELLRAAGLTFEVTVADVDETVHQDETPEAYVRRVAEAKAAAVAATATGRTVLGADTSVVVDGVILGKPADMADAKRMVQLLAGRVHEVVTGVCLIFTDGTNGRSSTAVETTRVEFAPMSSEEIAWYVSSGEPMGKAGAYAIQGLASRFVTRIEGSYSNVVGLPIALVYSLLRQRRERALV